MGKVITRDTLAEMAAIWRADHRQTVLTNGCYDLLHVGHLHTFRQAKQMGDILVVGINSDRSIRSIKGPGRPLVPEESRAELVAALEPVDFVTIFTESTAVNLITVLKPAVYVKGGDYRRENLPESEVLRKYDIDCRFIPMVPGYSTTELVRRICDSHQETVDS
jgi:rfaE bifunctional protein nucleotidyltransferase chain/domain